MGAFGLRTQKVALGPLVGAAVGVAAAPARRRRVPTAAAAQHDGAGVPDVVGAAVP